MNYPTSAGRVITLHLIQTHRIQYNKIQRKIYRVLRSYIVGCKSGALDNGSGPCYMRNSVLFNPLKGRDDNWLHVAFIAQCGCFAAEDAFLEDSRR